MTTMPPTTSTPSRALPALLTAAVASIVLGIMGMHALSTHGVMGMGITDHSTLTSPMTEAHGDAHGELVMSPASGEHAAMSSAAPHDGRGHDMSGLVLLCLAMLSATAGALLVLILGLRRRPRTWAYRLVTAAAVTRWVTARLGTGPPYVWQFSVIRC